MHVAPILASTSQTIDAAETAEAAIRTGEPAIANVLRYVAIGLVGEHGYDAVTCARV